MAIQVRSGTELRSRLTSRAAASPAAEAAAPFKKSRAGDAFRVFQFSFLLDLPSFYEFVKMFASEIA